MTVSPANRVIFLYAYSHLENDAVARAVSELGHALSEDKWSVRVLGLPQKSIINAGGSFWQRLGRAWSEATYMAGAFARILVSLPKTHAVVSVDVPSGIAFIGRAARFLSGGRVLDIAWVLDLYRLGGPLRRQLSPRARIEALALGASSTIVTIGSCMADNLAQLGVPARHVIPLWHRELNVECVLPPTVGERPIRLLYSGSARSIHPIQPLASAVLEDPDVEFRIIGSGPAADETKAIAEATGARNVSVLDRVSDEELQNSLGWADVHVVALADAATGTCVPSKVYASMAAGRAILYIGSSSGQAALDVRAAECGLIASPNDEHQIREALVALRTDPLRTATMGVNGKKYIASNRSLRVAAMKWNELLQESRPARTDA